jgi:hypothetical protein
MRIGRRRAIGVARALVALLLAFLLLAAAGSGAPAIVPLIFVLSILAITLALGAPAPAATPQLLSLPASARSPPSLSPAS